MSEPRIDALVAGLRALRLNQHFPPWRQVAGHLQAIARLPGGVQWDPETGWPAPACWLAVRSDQALAAEWIPRLRPLAAEDPVSAARLAWFEHVAAAQVLPPQQLSVQAVREDAESSTVQVTLDRFELGLPALVRWTFRLSALRRGAPFSAHALQARLNPEFEHMLRVLTTQDAAAAVLALEAGEGLQVHELVRGALGPIQHGPHGVRVSAVHTRVSPELVGLRVDDPLAGPLRVPAAHRGQGLVRLRKWAVPKVEQSAFTQALRAQGSRNLVYPYRPPARS